MTYATPEDVAVVLRGSTSVTEVEEAQWQAWLDVVERSIAAAFRRSGLVLTDRVAAGDPTTEDVADVETAAVVRKIQNPTWGRTSQTRSVDDGSITYRNEGAGASADPLALLPDEIARLLPGTTSTAFSIRPHYEPTRLPWPLDDIL